MKKKILSLIVGAVVGFTSLSTAAFASTSTVSSEKPQIMTAEQIEISNKFLAAHPELAKTSSTGARLMSSNGPAPKLTNYYPLVVAKNYNSSSHTYSDYEAVSNGCTTSHDFNGTIYVATVEVGYGRETTTFNENNVKIFDTVLLDTNSDGAVDKFIDVWKITNVTSGTFFSTSVSTNGTGKYSAKVIIK